MQVVINTRFGGFGLSSEALRALGVDDDNAYTYEKEKRADPNLIKVVNKLGKAANGRFANLKVIEIPDDVDWYIHDYDGKEEIHEKHRIWS